MVAMRCIRAWRPNNQLLADLRAWLRVLCLNHAVLRSEEWRCKERKMKLWYEWRRSISVWGGDGEINRLVDCQQCTKVHVRRRTLRFFPAFTGDFWMLGAPTKDFGYRRHWFAKPLDPAADPGTSCDLASSSIMQLLQCSLRYELFI